MDAVQFYGATLKGSTSHKLSQAWIGGPLQGPSFFRSLLPWVETHGYSPFTPLGWEKRHFSGLHDATVSSANGQYEGAAALHCFSFSSSFRRSLHEIPNPCMPLSKHPLHEIHWALEVSPDFQRFIRCGSRMKGRDMAT